MREHKCRIEKFVSGRAVCNDLTPAYGILYDGLTSVSRLQIAILGDSLHPGAWLRLSKLVGVNCRRDALNKIECFWYVRA